MHKLRTTYVVCSALAMLSFLAESLFIKGV